MGDTEWVGRAVCAEKSACIFQKKLFFLREVNDFGIGAVILFGGVDPSWRKFETEEHLTSIVFA
jgi:hypothetical protein